MCLVERDRDPWYPLARNIMFLQTSGKLSRLCHSHWWVWMYADSMTRWLNLVGFRKTDKSLTELIFTIQKQTHGWNFPVKFLSLSRWGVVSWIPAKCWSSEVRLNSTVRGTNALCSEKIGKMNWKCFHLRVVCTMKDRSRHRMCIRMRCWQCKMVKATRIR